jgi:hypothetical protein
MLGECKVFVGTYYSTRCYSSFSICIVVASCHGQAMRYEKHIEPFSVGAGILELTVRKARKIKKSKK